MEQRILLALDGSASSEKEVEYVARMVSQRDDTHVHLAHCLPPTTIGESESAGEAARELLEGLQRHLCDRGVAPGRVDLGTIRSDGQSSIAEALLDLARDQRCDTIVVGRNSLPWHRELLHHHPADELVRRAEGVAIWVVA